MSLVRRLKKGERSSRYKPGQFVSVAYATRYPAKIVSPARQRAATIGAITTRQVKVQRRVRRRIVAPPLPRVEVVEEFELTREADTKRTKGDRDTKRIDQTLRFRRRPGGTMPVSEARDGLARGKYGPVLAQFEIFSVDWANAGAKKDYHYTSRRDVEDALNASARIGWRYGAVRPL